jgi:hypothetical protein
MACRFRAKFRQIFARKFAQNGHFVAAWTAGSKRMDWGESEPTRDIVRAPCRSFDAQPAITPARCGCECKACLSSPPMPVAGSMSYCSGVWMVEHVDESQPMAIDAQPAITPSVGHQNLKSRRALTWRGFGSRARRALEGEHFAVPLRGLHAGQAERRRGWAGARNPRARHPTTA